MTRTAAPAPPERSRRGGLLLVGIAIVLTGLNLRTAVNSVGPVLEDGGHVDVAEGQPEHVVVLEATAEPVEPLLGHPGLGVVGRGLELGVGAVGAPAVDDDPLELERPALR